MLPELRGGGDDEPALDDGSRVWSRGELRRAVVAVASALRRRGVVPGSRVTVVLDHTPADVAALLGARAAGAVVCPVDRSFAPEMLPRLAATVVIADPAVAPAAVPAEALLAASAGTDGGFEDDPGGWGVTTSGTTGQRHTAFLPRRLVEQVSDNLDRAMDYRRDDRILCCLPFHHVYGLAQIWFGLRARATLLIPRLPLWPKDLVTWAGRASVLPAVPRLVRWLARRPPDSPLRLVTLSGSDTTAEERACFASALPATRFFHFYGLTEAFRVLWLDHEEFVSGAMTGRPTPGVEAWLDEEGELWVRGPNVASGYLDEPHATAARFPEPGVVRTGDLFERNGDVFRFVGRRDGVFKALGEKVVPELVEGAIKAHPGVEQCLVMSERMEDGELRPVAWIVPRDPAPARDDLLRGLRRSLPHYMIPARLTFVSTLSTTASGKVIRRRPSDPRPEAGEP